MDACTCWTVCMWCWGSEKWEEKSFQMADVLRQLERNYPDSGGSIDWADLETSVYSSDAYKLDAGAFKLRNRKRDPREARKRRSSGTRWRIHTGWEGWWGQGGCYCSRDSWSSWIHSEECTWRKNCNPLKLLVNPKSFSQTIENVFFTAFGAKQGNVKIGWISRVLLMSENQIQPKQMKRIHGSLFLR